MSNALRNEGMWAVSLKNAAQEIAEKAFYPEAIVVDPAVLLEPRGDKLVNYFARSPAIAAVPVLLISSAAKHVDLAELLGALHHIEEATSLRAAEHEEVFRVLQ